MKIISPKHSLRARLLLALAAMLVPLLILGAGTYYSFHLLSDSLNQVIEEALGEMTPLTDIQIRLQNTQIALHQAVHDGDGNARRRLAELMAATDKAFDKVSVLTFREPMHKEKFRTAWEIWRQGKKRTEQFLSRKETGEASVSPAALRTFDEDVSRAVLLLQVAHQQAEAEIRDQLQVVDATKRSISRLNAILFLTGVVMVLGIGFLLSRSIIGPIRQLEAGVRRFASGDLSSRIASRREDELGSLTTDFNSMAEELALERRRLQELSARDPLTGLYNHREFFRILTEEMERARRYRRPLSLLMLDLDFFKKVNDTFGHQAGDRALKSVSGIIAGELRRVDEVARYGGEEFAVILPETSGREAAVFADRIRRAIADRSVAVSEAEEIHLTVSIGVAAFPDDAPREDGLVNKADQALYRAKKEGRNRVCRTGEVRGSAGNPVSEGLTPSNGSLS